jgi:uncharacterized repeat protein (TIGR03803 family)
MLASLLRLPHRSRRASALIEASMSEIAILRQLTTTTDSRLRISSGVALRKAALLMASRSRLLGIQVRKSSLAMNRRQCPPFAIRLLGLFMVFLALGVAASAEWKEKVLYSFQGGNDGAVPAGGVVFDNAGNLYGATTYTSSCSTTFECGTVFDLSPPQQEGGAWTETTLHAFQGHDHNDGGAPGGGVILDATGTVYGTTAYGGTGNCILLGTAVGCGTVYEMAPPKQKGGKWTEKILYSFLGNKDGQFPWGDLVFDTAGNLYGATQFGGGFRSCDDPFYQHCGTVFELIAPKTKGGKWTEKVLYSFKNGKDGATPNGGLLIDPEGSIYGTTYSGGKQICPGGQGQVGCGVVFKLISRTRGQWTEHLVHSFTGGKDGYRSSAGLVFDSVGNLYGTATAGGTRGEGVLFRLTPQQKAGVPWRESILHEFSFGADGGVPRAALAPDASGNVLGTASEGTKFGGGTVFKLVPAKPDHSSRLIALYAFKGSSDGAYPASKVTLDGAGAIYGTTQQGGTGQNCQGGCGTVFGVSP